MTKNEMNLASGLLEMASESFSNHGCNDFDIENTRENVEMLNRMERENVGPGRAPEEVHVFDAAKESLTTSDWWLMSYLSKRLDELRKETK